MSWEAIPDRKPKSDGNKNMYMKLMDGESAVGILAGSPFTQYVKWVDRKKETSPVPKFGFSFRFQINFIEFVNGGTTTRIFEGGKRLYDDIVALHAAGYKLEETMVRLSRTGSGTDTRYSVMPSPKPLTAEQLQVLANAKRFDLGGKPQGDAPKTYKESELPNSFGAESDLFI